MLTHSGEIHRRLGLDFSQFLSLDNHPQSERITISLVTPPWDIIPKSGPLKCTDTSIIYEKSNVRYNDYHGKALTTVNSLTLESAIFTENLHLAHELAYLLILSKSGKKMDLRGFHKIHAMGVQINHTNVVLIAPSKGGKSTLFMRLLAHPTSQMISDDTPVIDVSGTVHPFPLRLGLEEGSFIPEYINKDSIYLLNRRKFGTKLLIPIEALGRSIAQSSNAKRTILIAGKRTERKVPRILRVGAIRMFPRVFISMIIGIGLPMILEYFFESGTNDIIKRVKIILSRTRAGFMLMMKSEKYFFEMSNDIDANESALLNFLKSS